jgi:hypothetical protein
VPAFLAGVRQSAAGEFGHFPSNSGIGGVGKPSYSLSLKIRPENAGLGFRRDAAGNTVKSDTKLQL